MLLLLKGHPGSGKSTLAEALARLLQWPLIDKDDARDCFQNTLPNVAQGVLNSLAYDVMFRMAATQLKIGLSVIIDCPLSRQALYDKAAALAFKYKSEISVVECFAQDEVWQARLESRTLQNAADQAHKPQSWQALQTLIAGYEGACNWTQNVQVQPKKYITVDTSKASAEDLAASVANQLQLTAEESQPLASQQHTAA